LAFFVWSSHTKVKRLLFYSDNR